MVRTVNALRILLIHDNSENSAALQNMISSENQADPRFEILTSLNLEDGSELLKDGTADAILLCLPIDCLTEVMNQSKKFSKHLPVIVLLDQEDDKEALSLLSQGVQDCLSLPSLTGAELRNSLLSAIARAGYLTGLLQTEGATSQVYQWLNNEVALRRETEKELRHSQAQVDHLIASSPDVIYTISAADGTVQLLNPAFEQMIGWTKSELAGKPFSSLVHPDDVPLAVETFLQVLAGETPPPYELRIRGKSGKYFFGEFRSQPMIENGRVVGELAMARNILKQKQAEYEKQSAEERFRTIVKNFPHGSVHLFDRSMCFVLSDGSLLSEWGIPKSFVEGKSLRDVFPTEVCNVLEPNFLGALDGKQNIFEISSSGHLYEVHTLPIYDDTGRVNVAMAISQDITDKREAEQGLKDALQKLRSFQSIVNNSHAVVFHRSIGPDESIDFVSENIRQFGYSADEIMAGEQTWQDIVHPDDLKRLRNEIQEHIRQGEMEFSQEYRIITKSGKISWIDDRNLLQRDSHGEISHIQGIMFDITDRKLIEDALRVSEAKYRSLVERLNDVVFTLDLDGNITYISPAIERLTHYQAHEIIGRPLEKIVHPEDLSGVKQGIQSIIDGDPKPYEFRITGKDGSELYLRNSCRRIEEKGKPVGIAGVMTRLAENERTENIQ